jgi:hypothetical protein
MTCDCFAIINQDAQIRSFGALIAARPRAIGEAGRGRRG